MYQIIDENENQNNNQKITTEMLGLKPTNDFEVYANDVIINEAPDKVKAWQDKGSIGVLEAGKMLTEEFDGTYNNVFTYDMKKDNFILNHPKIAEHSQKVDEIIEKTKFEKEARNKRVNEGTASFIDRTGALLDRIGNNIYQAQLVSAQMNENEQMPHKGDKNYKYNLSPKTKLLGKAIYDETDLRKQIGFLEGLQNSFMSGYSIPFIGGHIKRSVNKKLLNIADKIKNGEQITQDELEYFNDFKERQYEKQIRGYSIGGNIGESYLPSMFAFGSEMAVGGIALKLLGLAGKGKQLGTLATSGLTEINKFGKVGEKFSKGVGYTLGELTEGTLSAAVGGTIAGVLAGDFWAGYNERKLNDKVKITDRGTVVFQDATISPAKAFLKSMQAVYLSFFTESMGALIGTGLIKPVGNVAKSVINNPATRKIASVGAEQFDKVLKNVPKLEKFIKNSSELLSKIYETVNKLPIKGENADWLKSAVKFDGFLEELGEEVLEDVLNLALGTNDEERSLENYIKTIFKSPDEWAVLCGVIALQGGTISIAGNLLGDAMQRNGVEPQKNIEVLTNSTENEKLEYIDGLVKNNSIKVKDLTSEQRLRQKEIKDTVYEKLLDAGINEKQSQNLSIIVGSMFEKYGTFDEKARKIFDKFIDNVQIRFNVPVGEKTYYQPVIAGVKANQKVNVVDLSSDFPASRFLSKKDLSAYIKSLIDIKEISSKDKKAIFSIVKSSKRTGKKNVYMPDHIAGSSKVEKQHKEVRNTSVKNIVDLLENSILIEKTENKDKKGKPNVDNYLRFYVPIKINNNVFTVRIVAENNEKKNLFNILNADVYDVIIDKKIPTSSPSLSSNLMKSVSSSDSINENVENFNPDELTVEEMLKGVKDSDGKTYFQSVYHGSPHRFDEFSSDNIGTGEGNQAHGYGLYFAENKDVSERYRRTLSNYKRNNQRSLDEEYENLLIDGKPILENYDIDIDRTVYNFIHAPAVQSSWLNSTKDFLEKKVEEWQELLKDESYPFMDYAKTKVDAYKRLLKDISNGATIKDKIEGQLFKVDIPEKEVLLDEDKVIKEQSQKVIQSLKDLCLEENFNYLTLVGGFEKYAKPQTGKQIYSNLRNLIQMRDLNNDIQTSDEETAKIASGMLNKYGIKGITYDGQQDGRCYVIFDDKAVKVLETYFQSVNENVVDWTDKFDKVPTFEEIEKHIKDIIASGEVFETLSPNWKIDIKGGQRVVNKITNQGNFQELNISSRKRHNKYVSGIKELINNSTYSHSDVNNKQKEKPNVSNYHYFDVNVRIGEKTYWVRLECEETKNAPKGGYAKRSNSPSRSKDNINQTNNDVKTVHLYNIKEMKGNKVRFQDDNTNNYRGYYQNIEEQKLIAGYTYQEVMDKLISIWQEIEEKEGKIPDEEIVNLLSKAHILEKAFEFAENPKNIDEQNDVMLNAYYVMNNQEVPDIYVDTYKNSQQSLQELLEIHNEKKEQLENEFYNYFKKDTETKHVVTIMKNNNSSTALHEFGHLFLDMLNEMAEVNPDAKEQLDNVNKWLGFSGEYTTAQHEKFANNFVAYVYKGKAPNSKLKKVFENFKEWLKTVYAHVMDIPNVDISPEVQKMFDDLFGTDAFIQEKKQINDLLKNVKSISRKHRIKHIQAIDDKNLSDVAKKHKEVSYEILSVATGKDIKYLKTIFETNSNSKSLIKKRENIEKLLEQVDDKITVNGGFHKEWSEFYTDTGVDYDTDETTGDYDLAFQAYDVIINKRYGKFDETSELDERANYFQRAIENANREYKLLIRYFKNENRTVATAAIYEWLNNLPDEIKQDFEDKFIYDSAMIVRKENVDVYDKAKRQILQKAMELKNQYDINSNEEYKELVKQIVKSMTFLSTNDKAKITSNILDIPSTSLLMASIDNIMDIAKTMEDMAYRRNLENNIHKELQKTKNIKKNGRTVGKYNYQTNKIFEQLRKLDKLSREKADEIRLESSKFTRAEDNGISFEEKLYNKFLSYKADGRIYADTELMKSLYDDIMQIKLAGKMAKSELDLQEKLSEEQDIDELIDIIQKKKNPNAILKTYVNWFGNLESTINAIFNNEIKEKYASEILYDETNATAWKHEKTQNFEKKVAEIYNLPLWCWDKKILDYLAEKHTYQEIRRKYDKDGNIVKTRTINRTLTKMEIIRAYIYDKNNVTKKRLRNMFGDEVVDAMYDELSIEDVRLAELMMSTAQSTYNIVNKAFIKKYGLDLPKVSCYFPSTPERGSEVDLYNDYSSLSLNNGFTKARSNSETIPLEFGNPVEILYSHLDGVAKFAFMSESLDRANLRFKNNDLKRAIIDKYNVDVYRTLEQNLNNITYKKQAPVFNGVNKVFDNLISNWIQGNIAIKPIVGLKQLLSANNYAADMPYMVWQVGFIKALSDFKGTIDYMMKIPYVKARYQGNFSNEFLKQNLQNSAFATSKKLKDLCTIFVKIGDIGAIIFGGKPYIDYLIKEKGLSEQQAIKQFILSTNRSQQSSEIASLSNFQVAMSRNPFGKLFTAFKNSPQQYIRMCGDAIVSYANGDISKTQCAKLLFQFGYLQPFLYAAATSGSLFRFLFKGDPDDLKKDAITSIFNLNSNAIPFIDNVYQYAVQRLIFEEKFTPQSTPMIGDIQQEINRISKNDVTIQDYLFAFGYIIGHVGLGYNSKAIINSVTGINDIKNGDVDKGSLKVLGYTEKRTKQILK